MRLYSLTGASGTISTGEGQFEISDEDGSVDLPDEVSDHLHSMHIGGKKAWETSPERDARLADAERDRRRDPAALYDLIAAASQQQDSKPAARRTRSN